MKIHFTDSEQVVMDVLRDKQWHCLATELTGKSIDYRARITQEGAIKDKLESRGYTIEDRPCTLHRHKGGVKLRRIIKTGEVTTAQLVAANAERLAWFESLKCQCEWCLNNPGIGHWELERRDAMVKLK